MESCLPPPSPLAYLVGEHARAVVQIQELQREVRSLLSFREHVLLALPHLGPPMAPSGHVRLKPLSSSTGSNGKSLSEGSTAVADSGFNSDKATSMGKSSSSSSGLESGGTRWAPEEGDLPTGRGGGGGGLTTTQSSHEDVEETEDPEVEYPLGSAEDELWQLLEVIQRKGTRLRQDLEVAEAREREYGHSSDPQPHTVGGATLPIGILRNPVNLMDGGGAQAGPGISSFWPHSLPGAVPPHLDVGQFEAWSDAEKLRVERFHLIGRLSRAEADAAMSHQRLLDLHTQLVSLADEKRRVEEAFRALTIRVKDTKNNERLHRSPSCCWEDRAEDYNKNNEGQHSPTSRVTSKVHIGPSSPSSPACGTGLRFAPSQLTNVSPSVTVSIAGHAPRIFENSTPVTRRIPDLPEEPIILPRVLKVPIRDKSDSNLGKNSTTPTDPSVRVKHKTHLTKTSKETSSTQGNDVKSPKVHTNIKTELKSSNSSTCINPAYRDVDTESDVKLNRVVIERERNPNRIDGGLSMPASLLKGSVIKVIPNKQRISAILKEKDVLALQRQLLTTVMEVEVLKRQVECAEEEWSNRLGSWEAEKLKSKEEMDKLLKENIKMKEEKISNLSKQLQVSDAAIGTIPPPLTTDVCCGTTDEASDSEPPTFSVHSGPNVKYDVVIYGEEKTSSLRSRTPTKSHTSSSSSYNVHTPTPHPPFTTGGVSMHRGVTPLRKMAIEKPPRKSRVTVTSGSHHPLVSSQVSLPGTDGSFGRDSLGKITRVPLRAGSATPSLNYRTTPRSSPASSMSAARNGGPRSTTISAEAKMVQRTHSSTRSQSTSRFSSLKSYGRSQESSLSSGKGSPLHQVTKGGDHSASPSPHTDSPSPGPHKPRSKGPNFLGRWLNILE